MIFQHLALRSMDHRFHDAMVPAWFHARTMAHLRGQRPPAHPLAMEYMLQGICVPVLSLGVALRMLDVSMVHVLEMMVLLFILMILVIPRITQDFLSSRETMKRDADIYVQASLYVRAHLTGHEQLRYAQDALKLTGDDPVSGPVACMSTRSSP